MTTRGWSESRALQLALAFTAVVILYYIVNPPDFKPNDPWDESWKWKGPGEKSFPTGQPPAQPTPGPNNLPPPSTPPPSR
jgi:hypothetical protein